MRSIIADHVPDRQFTAEAPNQKWIADFTSIWTAEGVAVCLVSIGPAAAQLSPSENSAARAST